MYARGMELESFYAMRDGEATQIDGMPAHLTVVPLGKVRVPSGLLEASDPFVTLGDGTVFEVEPGDYEAYVTLADISLEQDGSHEREAYLSVVLREGILASVGAAASVRGEPETGKYWGVGVDAGTVAFCDHEAVAECMPEETEDAPWYEVVFDSERDDSWFALMDSPDHIRSGVANIVMPLASEGENIVLSHSGWGDGFYPVLAAKDSEGNTLALHVDLLVVGEPEDEEEDIPLVDGSRLKDDGSVEAPLPFPDELGAGQQVQPDAVARDQAIPGAVPGSALGDVAHDAAAPGLQHEHQQQTECSGISSLGLEEESPAPRKKGFWARLIGFFKRG